MAKKGNRNRAVPPPSIATGESRPWYKKTWPWLTGFAVVIGWILLNGPTALSNAEKLPSAVARAYSKLSTWYHTDYEWTGKWTNEGDIDARNQPEIFVDLDLLVQDGGVGGTITSGPQRDTIPSPFVLVEGAVHNNTMDVLAFDYFQGIPKRIATFTIRRLETDGLGQIKVVTTWQAHPLFPKEFTLWRAGDTELLQQRE